MIQESLLTVLVVIAPWVTLELLQPFLEWLSQIGQPVLLIGIVISLIWNAAVSYTQLKYIRKSMVTKKDLEASRLQMITI